MRLQPVRSPIELLWPGGKILALVLFVNLLTITQAKAFTANKVWFEARPNGIYRVHVNYTVPALREFREAYIEFAKRKDAEAFYWDAVRGADVFLENPAQRRFINQPLEPRPW